MATTHWTNGAGTNAWGTAGNWDNGVPTAADVAIIGSRSNASINGATVAGPAKVEFADSYTGDVGSAGTQLLFNSDCPVCNIHGSGKYYIGATGAGITIDLLKIRTRNRAVDAVNLYCASSGVIVDCFVLSGKVNIETATVTNLIIDWVTQQNADAVVDIETGGAVTTIDQQGGTLNSSAAVTTLRMHGGIATFSLGNITTAHIQAATLVYSVTGGTGTITTLLVFNRGRVDFTRTNDFRTVTTTRVQAGGIIDVRGVANSITFSNAPVVSGQGSEVHGGTAAFTTLK